MPDPRRDPAGAPNELLGWGIFLAATAAAAMVWAGVDWPVTAGCALLLLASFAAVWRVQRGTGRRLPAGEPAAAAAPLAAAAPEAAPVTAEPAPITRRQMRAADPSTGLLPIIQASARPVPQAPEQVLTGLNPIVPGGRRERRHAAGQESATAKPDDAAGQESVGAEPDAAAESRWTRTFGPPETGQLPVQVYVAGAAAGTTGTPGTPSDPDQPDRRQRSHSSL